MRPSKPATKTIDRNEFQEQVEQVLHEVIHDNLEVTIKEDGQPVAVVKPFTDDERDAARRRFFEWVEVIQQRANLSADEADALAQEAVEAVRRESREAKQNAANPRQRE